MISWLYYRVAPRRHDYQGECRRWLGMAQAAATQPPQPPQPLGIVDARSVYGLRRMPRTAAGEPERKEEEDAGISPSLSRASRRHFGHKVDQIRSFLFFFFFFFFQRRPTDSLRASLASYGSATGKRCHLACLKTAARERVRAEHKANRLIVLPG